MLIGVLGTMLARPRLPPAPLAAPALRSLAAITATAFHLDIRGALHVGAFEIIFVFLFVDLFDNIGTLVAVTKRAGLIDAPTTPSPASTASSSPTPPPPSSAPSPAPAPSPATSSPPPESPPEAAPASPPSSPASSSSLSLFVAPLVGAIPTFATAPALILVGGLMLTGLGEIDWDEPQIAIPAFLTLVTIPLTWSIANGLSFGLTSYAALQLLTGRAKRKDWMLYLLAALFLLRFIYLAKH